jgi:predicted nucleotidyltransferase
MSVDVQQIVDRLRGQLGDDAGLRLAVLFGSRSTGRARPDSDVDVAIVPREPDWSIWEEGRLASRLETALGLPVDVVRLDLASTLLRWEIVRTGVPIVADSPEEWTRTLVSVTAEHADFAPIAERAARSFLHRLAEAGPR